MGVIYSYGSGVGGRGDAGGVSFGMVQHACDTSPLLVSCLCLPVPPACSAGQASGSQSRREGVRKVAFCLPRAALGRQEGGKETPDLAAHFCQVSPGDISQISVLLEGGWVFSGMRHILGDSRCWGNVGSAGTGSIRVHWGQSPSACCGMSLLPHRASSHSVVVNYAINPTSNNIKLVFTPITPTGKLFSDLSALEAKNVAPISSLS